MPLVEPQATAEQGPLIPEKHILTKNHYLSNGNGSPFSAMKCACIVDLTDGQHQINTLRSPNSGPRSDPHNPAILGISGDTIHRFFVGVLYSSAQHHTSTNNCKTNNTSTYLGQCSSRAVHESYTHLSSSTLLISMRR